MRLVAHRSRGVLEGTAHGDHRSMGLSKTAGTTSCAQRWTPHAPSENAKASRPHMR
ncbi:hypothetical protein [Streptomyces sp. NWU339]|uniref:hypothetical protein n=1 Tax=Streptomyces sp. NWU339 TaxID=2185284 RepID=UPI0015E81D3E|nr:hypothetical protein [Streptomyces sp. NWU339]